MFSIGSCFAQHIADRLCHYRFYCINNPYGILFHPKPILKNIKCIKMKKSILFFKKKTVYFITHVILLYGQIQKIFKETTSRAQSFVANELIESNILILTFGTTFLYQLASSGKSVANCHKQSNHTFTKVLSSPDDIQTVFRSFYSELKKESKEFKLY